MNRKEIKEEELKYLAKEFKKNPELFLRETQVDDSQFLEKIGIFFPPNIGENVFLGYLKLWPEDFIVEEVLKDGSVKTVNSENTLNKQPNQDGQTTYATLVKCNISTIEAIDEMSSALNVEKERIQFAGIKDKDAITSQMVSFRKVNKEDVKKVSSPYFFLKDIRCGKGVMEVGGLKGNKFTILIRTNDLFNKERFLQNLEFVKQNGFFNFYYSQRFSSPRFINWFWGLQIIKGDYEKAILSYLCSEGQRETPYFKGIRKELKANFGNWERVGEIIKPFPIVMNSETRMVNYLKKNPSDFAGALKQIPEQIKLWVFAYSSLLFNRKISECLSEEKPLPAELPSLLSNDKDDWLKYQEFLKEDGILNLPIQNLRPFNFIPIRKVKIKTQEFAKINDIKVTSDGVILSFELPKACYATTFLSHLFELQTGLPPKNISENRVDAKESLGEMNVKETLDKFKEVIHSKSEDLFEKFE